MNVLTTKGFLQVGGVVLVAVGVLGYIGIIGPTAKMSIFGDFWWFDQAENLAHTVLGVVALLAAFTFPAALQRYLVIAVGLLGLAVGLYNFTSTTLDGAMLQSPADLVLHLAIGAWALYAAFVGEEAGASSSEG